MKSKLKTLTLSAGLLAATLIPTQATAMYQVCVIGTVKICHGTVCVIMETKEETCFEPGGGGGGNNGGGNSGGNSGGNNGGNNGGSNGGNNGGSNGGNNGGSNGGKGGGSKGGGKP